MAGLWTRKFKTGDEVIFSPNTGEQDVVGVIVNMKKNNQEVLYEISVADGALDIQGAAIVEVPEAKIKGLNGLENTPWYTRLGVILRIR